MSKSFKTPTKVDDIQIAFPAGVVRDLMPAMADIPEEFKDFPGGNYWTKLASRWFYKGLEGVQLRAKEGIDLRDALRHLKAIQGSWEPKHEHKEAAVGYLMSLWLEKPEEA